MSNILVDNFDVRMIPFGQIMPDKETPRSIRFPDELWKAIDADAKRCKRSAVKQMEAILSMYYDFSRSDIDQSAIEKVKNHNQPTIEKKNPLEAFRFSSEVEDEKAASKTERGSKSKK